MKQNPDALARQGRSECIQRRKVLAAPQVWRSSRTGCFAGQNEAARLARSGGWAESAERKLTPHFAVQDSIEGLAVSVHPSNDTNRPKRALRMKSVVEDWIGIGKRGCRTDGFSVDAPSPMRSSSHEPRLRAYHRLIGNSTFAHHPPHERQKADRSPRQPRPDQAIAGAVQALARRQSRCNLRIAD